VARIPAPHARLPTASRGSKKEMAPACGASSHASSVAPPPPPSTPCAHARLEKSLSRSSAPPARQRAPRPPGSGAASTPSAIPAGR